MFNLSKLPKNTYGGHAKCLRLMTGGGEGGQKSQKHAYVIHGCSLRNNTFLGGVSNFMYEVYVASILKSQNRSVQFNFGSRNLQSWLNNPWKCHLIILNFKLWWFWTFMLWWSFSMTFTFWLIQPSTYCVWTWRIWIVLSNYSFVFIKAIFINLFFLHCFCE